MGLCIFLTLSCGTSFENAAEAGQQELHYDDGLPESQNSPWSVEPGGQLAVVFTPPSHPARLTKVRFLVGINGIPTAEFRVRVFGCRADGGPDESRDLLSAALTASAPFGNKWADVDLSGHGIVIPEGDFCVSMEWLTPPGLNGVNAQFLGVDISAPDGRSWWKTDRLSPWERIGEVSDLGDRDVMIRATVAGR